MERTVYFLLLFLGVSSAAVRSGQSKQFRDYEYNRDTDSFYKLHIESVHYTRARDICTLEGAFLMVPSNKEDIAQVHGMLKKFPDIEDPVFIGNDGQKHESAEENPIIDLTPSSSEERREYDINNCEVMTRDGNIETTHCYYRHPFVCKIRAKEIAFDEQCGVNVPGFKYFDNVKSCYKVPPLPYTWTEAYAECRSQGAHLVVLNSAAESQTVMEFLKTAPRHSTAQTSYFFFAGIRAERPTNGSQRVFKTVFNETLEDAGFATWSDGEPNNYQDSEYCGSIFSNNGKYNDVDCTHNYGFICEKEVQ